MIKFFQGIIILALLILSGSLYLQVDTLKQENSKLTKQVAQDTIKLKKLHQKAPVVKADASADTEVLTPLEAAKLHFDRAQSAIQRKDYPTAVKEISESEDETNKAMGQVDSLSTAARRSITDKINELRKRIPGN